MSPTECKDKYLPITVPISEGMRISSYSRSELYRRLAAGQIRAVKSGSRTLILYEGLIEHLRTLPPAKFRAPASRRTDGTQ